MDKAEKKRLKKLGKEIVRQRSKELREQLAATNPAPFGSDEHLPLQTADRLPLSIRVVAWAFLITGVSSLVDAILQSFVIRHGPALNLHVVAIFIGRGLLRRREGWLRLAWGYNVFLLTVVIAATILLVGFYLFLLTGFADATNVTWSAPPGLLLPWLLGLSAYLVWQQRVLSRPDVRDLFRRAADARSTRPARRIQFSLGTLLMLVVLVALALPQVTDVDVLYERRGEGATYRSDSAGRQWTIHFGYRSRRFLSKPDEVDYVYSFRTRRKAGAESRVGPLPEATPRQLWRGQTGRGSRSMVIISSSNTSTAGIEKAVSGLPRGNSSPSSPPSRRPTRSTHCWSTPRHIRTEVRWPRTGGVNQLLTTDAPTPALHQLFTCETG